MKNLTPKEIIGNNDNFLIITHRRADGDTTGSAAALCRALRGIGKTAYILENPDMTPRLLRFAGDFFAPADFAPQTVIAVDIADEGLFTKNAEKYRGAVDLCIDHHQSNMHYAKTLLLDADEAAVGVLIWELAEELGYTPDKAFAEAVYLAVATDTGCFKYSNTTPKAHTVAASCMRFGADFHAINTEFFVIKTEARIKLEQKVSENTVLSADGFTAGSFITKDYIEALGATEDDLDNLSSFMLQHEKLLCGILLTENKARGSYKVSVRTRAPLNASKICAIFGGGGHARASGCNISGSAEDCRARLMEAAARELADV